jgi:hypothetical protein
VSAKTSCVLPPTFLRSRFKHHGGVTRREGHEGYFLKSSDDLSVHLKVSCPLYYLDTDKPNVYGHVLLEAVPRLWAISKADKETRFVTSVKANRNYDKMFSRLGADPSRIIRIDSNRPIATA